ncbi:DUF1127 domain-containing protein [Paracoccus litorisediminis]|uniref:DUF1127 domain-containing protein n=1 Tax=Paracoccus litorisediminis TaxID=2006130 RepID=UPI00372E8B17
MTAIEFPSTQYPSLLRRLRAHALADRDTRRMERELLALTNRELLDVGIHPGDIPAMLDQARSDYMRKHLEA